ncbi:UNVERIFIED_CONTAM: hypothetical protein HHA_257910 [Hammondia hammondi]|eukprot:XP_008883206.1 hypothetical protein HHA_257910 [Hammondia hammondi]
MPTQEDDQLIEGALSVVESDDQEGTAEASTTGTAFGGSPQQRLSTEGFPWFRRIFRYSLCRNSNVAVSSLLLSSCSAFEAALEAAVNELFYAETDES